MKLYVGLSALRGSVSRFSFDLLELTVSPTMPRTKALREWREARPDLVFSLRLHPDIAMAVDGSEELLARAERALEVLGDAPVVVATGPTFSPTTRNQERLVRLAERFRTKGRLVAWESRGVFQDEELASWAEVADVAVVRDLTRETPITGGCMYARLLPFGFGAKVTQSGFERLAAAIEGADEAYIVVQSEGARGLRNNLRELFEVENA